MKISHIACFFFLTAAALPCASAAEQSAALRSEALPPVPRRIRNGMTRAEVLAATGQPDAILDRNVWAYWPFTAQGVPESAAELDTLLVVFEGERVKFFKFVAPEPVREFLAQKARAAVAATAKQKVAAR